MSTNRYYFSNFIEDDTLSVVAVTAKEMLQQIDYIVKIYQKNNELLYGQSPKQILFLMNQNNKPLNSSSGSPISGDNSCVSKSNQGPSTPVSRNSDISNLPRILLPNLPIDDTEKKLSDSGALETSTPVRQQTRNSPGAGSSTGSPGAGNQDSPRSAELSKMTANLNIDEKDLSCKNKDTKILNPIVDETSKVDGQFASPLGSRGSPEAGNQDSPCSAKIVMMTESLTMDGKEVRSPAKIAVNTDTDNQESPRSSVIIKMTSSMAVKEKDTSSVLAGADGEFNPSNQASSLILDDKESRNLVAKERVNANTYSLKPVTKSGKSHNPDSIHKDSINPVKETFKIPMPVQVIGKDQIDANSATDTDFLNSGKRADESTKSDTSNEDSVNSAEGTFKILKPAEAGNETSSPVNSVKRVLVEEDRTAANTDFFKPGEKSGKSDDADSNNKDSLNLAEGMIKIPNPIKVGNETPSPVKSLKMCNISAVDIQEFSSPPEKVKLAESSPEETEVSVSPIQGDKMNISPNEASQGITVDLRKRKSPSPKRRNPTIFRSIPRVIQSVGDAEMDIEVPCDSADHSSPTTSRISSTANSQLTKSPLTSESKTDDSPNTVRRILSPSKRAISISSSCNVSRPANPAEGMVKIPNPIKVGNETPSPIKRSKMYSDSAVDIDKLSSPLKKVKLVESSPEDTEVSVNPIQGDKMNLSSNKASQGIAFDLVERKPPSPIQRNATIFRSISRATQSVGEAEIDIEVPCDSDQSSPTTSRILSTANSPITKSPLTTESKTDDSPNTVKRILSPSERAISISSSRTISRTNSSGSDDDNVFIRNNPSGVSSIMATATGSRSCKSESSLTYNEPDYFVLKHTILKFYTLYTLRHQVLRKIFISLWYFQRHVGFLNMYANNVGWIANTISLQDKWYSIEELKETVNDTTAIASKLKKKLTAWKTDIDLDVNTWQKCSEQIQQLKAKYGPIESDDGEPRMTIETLQVYEHELKAIWKKLDDMIMMGDTRRALFSQTSHDFEKLIKLLVKCLIMVGILQPR